MWAPLCVYGRKVCLLGACINLLLPHNNCILHFAAESKTHLLSHISAGQKSRHGSTGFSAQDPTRLISGLAMAGFSSEDQGSLQRVFKLLAEFSSL